MTTAVPAARRWPVISALGVVMIFTWGSTYYLMTVLALPIAEDTGWSLTSITGALSAGLLVAGLADLPPKIRAIANWNLPLLNGRRRKSHEAQAVQRREDHRRAEGAG
jgi:hypothetical protein